eukprot:3572301-Alexandrium_andersonii.AAC.1
MLQTGYSPRILRAAAKVDQALRDHVFQWLRNPTEASPATLGLFHTPLRDGGLEFPDLQARAASACLGSWARVSSSIREAIGWGTLAAEGPDNQGKTRYQAAWG